jgi:bifunctional non-homologous end joining protein LigD
MSDRHISHPDKVLFPEVGITKQRLADYYERIAEHLLPHVAGRPLVLQRFPDGIDGAGFYQKNTPDHVPDSIGRIEIDKAGGGTTTYTVIDDADDLVYLADQATIVLHTLLVRAERPDRPVEIVFDLDPSSDDLAPVRSTARALRELLGGLDLAPRVKSSGSRGLHVVVDVIDDDVDFETTTRVAGDVAELIAGRLDEVTIEQRKARRDGRLFLDVLRNAPAQHAVAPYSPRALASAPIAAPLDWDEALANDFRPQRVTIDNVFRRLGQRDDPWSSPPRPDRTIADAHDALPDE